MIGSGAAAADLVVDSATGVEVHMRVAGPGARSFAYLVDWNIRVVLALAWFVVAAMIYNRGPMLLPRETDATWLVGVLGPAAAIYFLYHWVLELAMRGSTPGKRMAGIRIAGRDGGAPTAGPLLTRNVFRLIDSLPFAYGVGLLTVMLTREHVRIGDLAAGTLLVYSLVAPPPPRPPTGIADIAWAEAAGDLVQRWSELEPASRRRLALRLLDLEATPSAPTIESAPAADGRPDRRVDTATDEDARLRVRLEQLLQRLAP